MSDEKITVTMSEEQFVKGVLTEVMDSDFVMEMVKHNPIFMLVMPVLGHEFWQALEKYSRMQQVADVFTTIKED